MKGSVDYLTTQYSGLTIGVVSLAVFPLCVPFVFESLIVLAGRASPSLLEAIEVKAYGDLRFLTVRFRRLRAFGGLSFVDGFVITCCL